MAETVRTPINPEGMAGAIALILAYISFIPKYIESQVTGANTTYHVLELSLVGFLLLIGIFSLLYLSIIRMHLLEVEI